MSPDLNVRPKFSMFLVFASAAIFWIGAWVFGLFAGPFVFNGQVSPTVLSYLPFALIAGGLSLTFDDLRVKELLGGVIVLACAALMILGITKYGVRNSAIEDVSFASLAVFVAKHYVVYAIVVAASSVGGHLVRTRLRGQPAAG